MIHALSVAVEDIEAIVAKLKQRVCATSPNGLGHSAAASAVASASTRIIVLALVWPYTIPVVGALERLQKGGCVEGDAQFLAEHLLRLRPHIACPFP